MQRFGHHNEHGFRGVFFEKERGVYRARIDNRWLGRFEKPEPAARAYDQEARRVYGAEARLNFPEPGEMSSIPCLMEAGIMVAERKFIEPQAPAPLLALPAPRPRFAREPLMTPAVIYLSGPVAPTLPPPSLPRLRSKLQEAEIAFYGDLGSRLGSPLVVHEIDKAIAVIAKLREFAADLHGIKKPPPWNWR